VDRSDIKAGRPPKGQAAALNDHIIDVAGELFIEKGFGTASMATIASQARIGKQTLYDRFPDKAALFRAVIGRRIDAMLIASTESTEDSDPLKELKKLGRHTLDRVLDPGFVQLHRIVIAEALPFPELARAAADCWGSSFKDRCTDAIRRAQERGTCRPGDPETLAQCFLWGLVGEPFLRSLSGQEWPMREEDRTKHLEGVWRVFTDGISPADDGSALIAPGRSKRPQSDPSPRAMRGRGAVP
jgi:TetR/AcrR family transcriptional repressor of mexJK operon